MLSLRDFDGDGLFTLLAKVPPAPVMCKVMNCRIFYKLTVTAVPCLAYKHYSSISSVLSLTVCTICNFPSCTTAQGLQITQKCLILHFLKKEIIVENAKIAQKTKN